MDPLVAARRMAARVELAGFELASGRERREDRFELSGNHAEATGNAAGIEGAVGPCVTGHDLFEGRLAR